VNEIEPVREIAPVSEIAPGIFRWQTRHPEWHTRIEWGHEVASFALSGDRALTLVDPQLPAADSPARPAVEQTLDRLAEAASRLDIMITIPYHARSAEELFERYRESLEVAIWGHPAVAKRFSGKATPLTPIEPGEAVGRSAVALAIGKPRRYETPLYFAAHKALAFGDAVIGIDGGLRVWQQAPTSPTWYDERFAPTLAPLLQLDVERVLPTHGDPVLHDARRALRAAMAAGPWDYRNHSS
jgi:hypothetical protein